MQKKRDVTDLTHEQLEFVAPLNAAAAKELERRAQFAAGDAYMDLMERVTEWCKSNLNHSDLVIAKNVEEEFGIDAGLVLAEFGAEDGPDHTTAELIMRAYGKRI